MWDNEEPQSDHFRYGIEISTDSGWERLLPSPEAWSNRSALPTMPLIHPCGATGTRRRLDLRAWLWPLLSAGRFAVSCAWPGANIPLTKREFDAAAIGQASARALELWDGPTPHGNQLWLTTE